MDDETEHGFNDSKHLIKKLHDTCNWNRLDNVAIEYHDLQNSICIHYRDLFAIKNIIADYLKCIKGAEFIGIHFDVPEYCVISVILGILSSRHSFVNIPSNIREFSNLKNYLNIRFLFCDTISVEGDILHQFTIHDKRISLIKLKSTQKQITENAKQNDYYAYAISTSGSTGTPKVVKVLHSCIVPNILDLSKILAITECDKIAQLTNFTFDPSLVEIFIALSNAATLFIASSSLKKHPNRLLKVIHSSRITILQITPSVFIHNWATERLRPSILSNDTSLRAILFGGESFPKAELLSEMMHPCDSIKLYNIYGITEVSCWASINQVTITNEKCNTHYLGQVLSHTEFQVRNERGEIITKGTGSLYIGSNERLCVINDEDIEELKLPVFRDSRDIVSIDEEGRIFYKGRRNSVIKRFGNKVDLTKLEEFVLRIDFVKSCHLLWDNNCHRLHLCFCVKDVASNRNATSDIMKHLCKLDPLYRPDKVHFLDHVEFTSSGKMSVEFLRELCAKEQIANRRVSDDVDWERIETIFKSVWENNLQCTDDGFVKLGGTSVIALQISSTMSETANAEFPELIGMLLTNATIDECLSYIKSIMLNINEENPRTDFDSTKRIPSIITIAIEGKEPSEYSNAEEKTSDSMLLTNEICICEWYKCRGQTNGNAESTNRGNKLQYDAISRVKILETYDLKKCVDASPTVFYYSDGKTYATVGSHSGFICTFGLEKERRNSVFKIKLPDRIEASVLILDNFRGVVGCYDGNVYCVHLQTGNIIWNYKTGDVVKCSPIFCKKKQMIIVGSYDCHIYCLSAKDGSEIWKLKSGNGSISASGCLHFSSNTVLFGTLDGSCLALQQSSGKLAWKHKLPDPIFTAPLSLNSGLVLFCSVTGLLCCFDIEVNVKMWTYKINGNVFAYLAKQNDPASKRENIILASQNKNVYCLQSEDANFKTEPTLKYVLNLHSPILATPWCEDNFLFVACAGGTLNIYNFLRNRLIKIVKLPGEVFSSPVVDNDLIIIGCRDNNVYVLQLV